MGREMDTGGRDERKRGKNWVGGANKKNSNYGIGVRGKKKIIQMRGMGVNEQRDKKTARKT